MMRDYGTWENADGKQVPLQTARSNRAHSCGTSENAPSALAPEAAPRPVAWFRGWLNIFVAPAGAAITLVAAQRYSWVWLPWTATVLIAVTLAQAAVLIYAVRAWSTADARRRTYRAASVSVWVVADVLIGVPIAWCWLMWPTGRGPDLLLRFLVVAFVAGTALDWRSARATREWRPWNPEYQRARRARS